MVLLVILEQLIDVILVLLGIMVLVLLERVVPLG
jgi:hypothetical protein